MKKIKFLMIALAAILLASCSKSYKVSVQLEADNLEGKTAYLYAMSPDNMMEPLLLDSAAIKGNKVTIEANSYEQIQLPVQAVLAFYKLDASAMPDMNIQSPVMFFLEEGDVKIELKKDNKMNLSGTPSNDDYGNFLKKADEAENNFELQEKMAEEASNAFFNIIKRNINNNIGYSLLPSPMIIGVLTPEQTKELLPLITDDFKNKVTNSSEVVEYLESKAKSALSEIIDADLTKADGTTEKLSDLVKANKYTLIDFWASWCRPCINEVPNLKSAYEAYKDKGFEIVGISVDESAEDWKSAIEQHEMNWLHFNDGAKDGVASTYGVTSIPHTLLVDSEGKVVEMNVRGDQLMKKLGELLD